LTETIQIEKIPGTVKQGFLNLQWNVVKRIGEIQHYTCSTPITPTEHGAVIDNIHIRMPENEIGLFLPFTDDEKICWECGAERILEIMINIECLDLDCVTWQDWCYNPQYKRVKK